MRKPFLIQSGGSAARAGGHARRCKAQNVTNSSSVRHVNPSPGQVRGSR